MSKPGGSNVHVERKIIATVSKFKELAENDQIELIQEASTEVEEEEGGVARVLLVLEKVPEESDEDYRARRFAELLKNLPIQSLHNYSDNVYTKWLRQYLERANSIAKQRITNDCAVERFGQWDGLGMEMDGATQMFGKVKAAELRINQDFFKMKTLDLRGVGGGGLETQGGDGNAGNISTTSSSISWWRRRIWGTRRTGKR